jgi:hypothetical protein
MALVFIKGHAYYTQSIRRGGKVTSTCRASGEFAHDLAQIDAIIREKKRLKRFLANAEERERIEARRATNQEVKAIRDRLDKADRCMAGYSKEVRVSVHRILIDLGFHRHARGHWRRRRKAMATELAPTNGSRDLEREHAAAEYRIDADLYRRIEEGHGEIEVLVEQILIAQFPKENASHHDAIAAKLELMRRDLAPPPSPVAEILLASRAAMCWLHVQYLELDLAYVLSADQADSRKAEVIDRRLSRAQARFSQALTALERIRRLKIPVVVTQFNQQLNVNTQSAENSERSIFADGIEWPSDRPSADRTP